MSKVICFAEAQKKRDNNPFASQKTSPQEIRRLQLARHDSFLDLIEYKHEVENASNSEILSIVTDDETVHALLASLLSKNAHGNADASNDVEMLEMSSLGIHTPMTIEEIRLLPNAYNTIQVIKHRISAHKGELLTAEANQIRKLLHKHLIGPQFIMETVQSFNSNTGKLVPFKN
ncbi:MAG: hypothetical protein IE928_08150 [Gammaproteobacteria bacterium]|nr:hypothetical protein [Gammaproteobacteria bacterium]MBD3822626.1 hypothetical protein [Thiotrichales bacterium]